MTTIIYKTNFDVLTHQQATSLKNIYEEDQIINLREDWHKIIETGLPVNCLVFTHLKKKKIRELINRPECDFIHFDEAIELLDSAPLPDEFSANQLDHEAFMNYLTKLIALRLMVSEKTISQRDQLILIQETIDTMKKLEKMNNTLNQKIA